jgi:hypothetical protein
MPENEHHDGDIRNKNQDLGIAKAQQSKRWLQTVPR